jgi:SNF2 family DNA or RNA helicase
MFVVPSKRKLVFRANDHNKVSALLPTAKAFNYDGAPAVAVDHSQDAVRILRNIGYRNVPSPIRYYYDWSGLYKPMPHQIDTAEFMSMNSRALCLNAPGTGKTVSVLWAADHMLQEGIIKRILIIAPLSTLKPVWGNEIMRHFMHLNFVIVTGDRKRKMKLASDKDADVVIINHDGFTTMPSMFYDCDLIIYDEATALKTPTSIRYKTMFKYMRTHRPRLWLLTGTPISQNPTDAWTLSKLCESPKVPATFTHFKELTMRKVSQFKWIPRPEALSICKEVMQPSIRFSLDECKDLPDTVYVDRGCELTKMQSVAFDEMLEKAVVAGTDIEAANAAVLFSKLVQISCGVAYDTDGDRVHFDDAGRVDALTEIIDEIGDKVIIFVPLRGVQDRLETLLGKHYDVASVHGGVSKNERNKIFDIFQNSDKIKVLIAHPKVAAHGLTLTRSRCIIWYAPIYSLEQYEQANARIRRLNTQGRTVIYHIYATKFEKTLYGRLKNKQKILNDFLALVRGTNED